MLHSSPAVAEIGPDVTLTHIYPHTHTHARAHIRATTCCSYSHLLSQSVTNQPVNQVVYRGESLLIAISPAMTEIKAFLMARCEGFIVFSHFMTHVNTSLADVECGHSIQPHQLEPAPAGYRCKPFIKIEENSGHLKFLWHWLPVSCLG